MVEFTGFDPFALGIADTFFFNRCSLCTKSPKSCTKALITRVKLFSLELTGNNGESILHFRSHTPDTNTEELSHSKIIKAALVSSESHENHGCQCQHLFC